MPRSGSGAYTLPAGNPVVAGTTIEANWANTTLNDVATELTGSLARSGAGGMTGPLRLDAGTSGVPALAFSAETTTGLYRAGTNDVRFAVATVDVLQLTASGVTLPLGTANGVLYLNGSKVATSGSALFFDGTNFGIGTTVPGALLGVSGAGNIVRFGDGTNTFNIRFRGPNNWSQQLDTASDKFSIQRNSVDFVVVDSAGNLGIGTASPGARLHVAGGGNILLTAVTNGSDGILDIRDSGAVTRLIAYSSTNEAWFGTVGSKPIAFQTNNTERMRLDASGNLGIGTTTPNSVGYGGTVLGLYAGSSAGGNIWITSDSSVAGNRAGRIGFGTESNTVNKELVRIVGLVAGSTAGNLGGDLAFLTKADGGALAERMRLDASGNLGIGTTSPGGKLDVYGGASGTNTNVVVGNAATAFALGVDTSNNCQIRTAQAVPIIFYTSATQRMQIDANGNIFGTAGTTSMTNGFFYIPGAAGVPSGTPTAVANRFPAYVDTTNNRLYIHNGTSWRYASLV